MPVQESSLNPFMMNYEPKTKKNINCKNYSRVIRVLKEFVRAIIIIKQILNL